MVYPGIEMAQPVDMIKDPYVFEFLCVPENDLEKALVAQIEKQDGDSSPYRGYRGEE